MTWLTVVASAWAVSVDDGIYKEVPGTGGFSLCELTTIDGDGVFYVVGTAQTESPVSVGGTVTITASTPTTPCTSVAGASAQISFVGSGIDRLLTIGGSVDIQGVDLVWARDPSVVTEGSGGLVKVENGGTFRTDSAVVGGKATEHGGCVSNASGTVDIRAGEVRDCFASMDGGGVHTEDGTVTLGRVSGNEALGNGGGVAQTGGKVEVVGAEVANNLAHGDGGGAFASGDGTELEIAGDFIGNQAFGHGGAVRLTHTATLGLIDTTMANNRAQLDGGAIHADAETLIFDSTNVDPPLGVGSAIFENNLAGHGAFLAIVDREGGAIYLSDATMELDELLLIDIKNNRATGDGGGIAAHDGSTLDIRIAARVQWNEAEDGRGGGVLLEDADTSLLAFNVDIDDNDAATTGGGMEIANGATFNVPPIATGIVQANASTLDGAGLHVDGGSVTIGGHLTITGNQTPAVGGGLALRSDGSFTMDAGIVSNNTASSGAGISVHNGDLTLGTTLFDCGLASSCIRVEDNQAVGSTSVGGGFYFTGSNTQWYIYRTRVLGNEAAQGAGIMVDGPGAGGTFANLLVLGNDAPAGPAAAIRVDDGLLDCVHCTVGLNERGLQMGRFALVGFWNSIIADNGRDFVGRHRPNAVCTTSSATVTLDPDGVPFGDLTEVVNLCTEAGFDRDIRYSPRPDLLTGSTEYDRGAYEFPECGNGILEFGELCDDGNTVNNDACSVTCQPQVEVILDLTGTAYDGEFEGQCSGNTKTSYDVPTSLWCLPGASIDLTCHDDDFPQEEVDHIIDVLDPGTQFKDCDNGSCSTTFTAPPLGMTAQLECEVNVQ